MELEAGHTHLYPGATGHADGPFRDGPVTVAFADGVRVAGRLAGDRLAVAAHRTARGTAIAEKAWVIAAGGTEPDGRVPFRVTARA